MFTLDHAAKWKLVFFSLSFMILFYCIPNRVFELRECFLFLYGFRCLLSLYDDSCSKNHFRSPQVILFVCPNTCKRLVNVEINSQVIRSISPWSMWVYLQAYHDVFHISLNKLEKLLNQFNI